MDLKQTKWNDGPLRCVVMCGGNSSRFKSEAVGHKSLTPVAGKPLIQHVIDFWQDYTDDFVFVVKNGKEYLIDYISTLDIKSEFVEPEALRGIADGLSYVEPHINAPFILVLGDCFCSGQFDVEGDFGQGIGVLPGASQQQVHESYAVYTSGRRVIRVVESPKEPDTDLCGTGFYFLSPSVFDYIRETAPSAESGELEITDVLQTMVDGGIDLQTAVLKGTYVNANTLEDLETIGRALAATAD